MYLSFAGLAPILFAISIDRIDLNHYKKNGWTDSNSEQVIVTVPMGKSIKIYDYLN